MVPQSHETGGMALSDVGCSKGVNLRIAVIGGVTGNTVEVEVVQGAGISGKEKQPGTTRPATGCDNQDQPKNKIPIQEEATPRPTTVSGTT